MDKIIKAILVTIIMGYIGIIIGEPLNFEGYLGVIFSIATMGYLFFMRLKVKSNLERV